MATQVTLPDYELLALIKLLRMAADHFGEHIYEDIDFAALVPDLAYRREMKRLYHDWNGDPEVHGDDEAHGDTYTVWTYSSLLGYFAHRLAPEIDRELHEQAREQERRTPRTPRFTLVFSREADERKDL